MHGTFAVTDVRMDLEVTLGNLQIWTRRPYRDLFQEPECESVGLPLFELLLRISEGDRGSLELPHIP